MFELFPILPVEFWIVIALLFIGFVWGAINIRRGIGIPVAMILLTVAIWYVVDVLYNDYRLTYFRLFPQKVFQVSWQQVIAFLLTFLSLTSVLHKLLNKRYRRAGSQVYEFYKKGIKNQQFQYTLTILFRSILGVWLLLIVAAIFRFQEDFVFFLFPFFGKHSGPWVTSGIGGGINSFLALANYLHLMVGALSGVVAALSTNIRIRRLALLILLLTWPHYIFHRTRKFILIIVLPGLLAWIFLRKRGRILQKLTFTFIFFLILSAWFGFVISHRSTSSIASAFLNEGFDFSTSSSEKHQGLNMYEELCWIVSLTSTGRYQPNMGANYFANLVNPIPRSIWPGKPTIGLDYAIARGMGGANTRVGVYATLSNGVIGQGVVNFGLYIGPAVAALLMSLWAVWLARIDLLGHKIGYLPLYSLGLILTFTMGRDITFLELYPFVFGYSICWWLNRNYTSRLRHKREKFRPPLPSKMAK